MKALAVALALLLAGCASLDCLRNPVGCVGGGGGETTPSPVPPSPSPPESPKPSPSATPSPSPTPIPPTPIPPPPPPPPCVPTTTVKCPTPPPGYVQAAGYSAFYKLPKAGRCYAPVAEDSAGRDPETKIPSAITWNDCDSCEDMRAQNIRGEGERPCRPGEPTYGTTGACWKSHWEPWWPGMTEAQKKRGLLNALPAGYINKDCDLENADGTLQPKRRRESGHLGRICPREVQGVVTASPCPPSPKPPSPTPPPPSGDTYCTLAPGALNWPLMPGSDKLPAEGGICPPCWGDHPEQIVDECGLTHTRTLATMGGAGRRYLFDVTCHSTAPRCPHRPDQRRCDVLWGCQPHEPAMYQTGPGFNLAPVDRRSNNFYLGQINITNPAENGRYEVWACPPGIRPDGPGQERCEAWRGYVGTDGELR